MLDMTNYTPINHHLLLAYYSWLAENGAKIHLGINAMLLDDASFLHAYADQTQRVALSVGPAAVRNFVVDADGVSFDGTFNAQHRSVFVPLNAIEGVTGWLPDRPDQPVGFHLPPMVSSDPQPEETTEAKPRPKLSIVK